MGKAVKAAVKVFVVTFAITTGLAFVFNSASLFALGQVGLTGAFLGGVSTLTIASLSAASTLVGGLMSKGTNATAENFGTKVATRTSAAPRQIIYGKARVGGTITHIETSGTDNYKLSMIVVLAGHEVESLEEVLINDTKLTTTSSGGFQYATNSRFTNSENENKFSVGNSLLRYKFKDGSQTTADSDVTSNTSLGSTDKFIGMAYMLIEMVFDSEAFGGGIPPMAFVIKGKKVYDPRTSTTAWSDNPALCVRDFITDTTYGLKATSDEVLDTTALGGFASAANTCENQAGAITTATVNGAVTSSTTVTIDSASTNTLIDIGQTVTGTGISNSPTVIARRGNIITLSSAQTISDGVTLTFNEDLYKANGITNMAADGTGVLEGLLSACAGKLSYINGKFVMFAGATVTPDMTITDDNLLAPISVATKNSGGETFNTVKAVYVDANNNYVATDSPVYTDSTLIANDTPSGESQANYRKTLELQLPFTDTTTMAQRLQRTALLHSRQEVSLSVLCNIAFMQLQPFDWVYLTNERLGYTNKTFEVLATNLEVIESDDVPILATRLALKEIDSSVYSFASSSYTNPIDEGSSVSTGSFTVTAPTNLSVSATLVNTGYDLQVQWTNNTDDLIQGTEILYGTSSGTYISSAIAGKGKTKEIIPNVKPNSTYYIVARHFSANNVFSAVTSEVTISTSSGTGINTPSAPTSLSATTGKPLNIGLSWTNPSNSDLRDIKIYRSTSSGFTPNDGTNLVRTIAGVPSVSQKVSFGIDDGLVASTTYYFKVKAVSFFDKESSASSQASGSFTKVEATDIDAIFSGYFHVEGSTTTALTDSAFNTAHGRLPIEDDILIMVNTSASTKVSKAYKYSGTSGSGGSFVEITNFQTGDLIVDGTIAGSKIIADTVNGNVFQATTTITAGTGNNVGVLDGADSTFRIYAGNATPTSAPFRVSQTGALTATSGEVGGFTLGATSLTNTAADSKIQIGSGSEIFTVDGDGIYLGNGTFANAPFKVLSSGEVQTTKSFTAGVAGTDAIAKMSGTGDYRFWSGNEAPSNASFSVDKDGKAIAKNLVLKLTDGTVYFDSETGFSSSALSQISLTTGTKVTTLSSTFDADTEYEEITVTQNTTVNVSVSIDSNFGGSGGDFNANTAIDEAEQDVPENFTLTIEHSSDGGSSYSTVVTDTFSRVNDRLNPKTTPASDEYKINTTTEELFISGQGGVVYLTTTTTSLNLGCVDADGRTTLSYTGLSLSGISTGTTHRIRASVSTTDTNYDTTNNNVSSTAPRVVSVTDPSGDGFYVGDSSGSQVTPEGDITRVQITTASSSGLTGGANFTSGDALFTLALASSIDGAKTFTNNVVIQGDLDVQGTTTTIDTTNLDVKDKNITLNYGTGDTSANANGAGITIQDAVSAGNDATLTWNTSNDSFNFSHDVNVTGGLTTNEKIIVNQPSSNTVNELLILEANDIYSDVIQTDTGGSVRLRTNSGAYRIYTGGAATSQTASGATQALILDSSQNATFAGTINSGAITADGLTVDTTTLVVDSTNNRVGIGTSSPSQLLEISGADAPSIRLNDTTYNQYAEISTANAGSLILKADVGNGGTGSTYIGFEVDGASEKMRISPSVVDVNVFLDLNDNYITGVNSYRNSNDTEIIDSNNTSYTILKSYAGANRLWLGESATYLNNTNYYFRDASSNNLLTLNTNGLNIRTAAGGLLIEGTEVITGSRNLTNIGTISSGQLNVNSSTTNTTAVFESTDDKAFIRIKDDDTDTYLISKDGNFSIGDSSTDYDNFKVDISSGNTVASGGTHTFGSSSNTATTVNITATNTAGAPAEATKLVFNGYEARSQGLHFTDSSVSGERWFAGIPYSGAFDSFQIGYDQTGDQAEYAANSVFRITDGGYAGIGIGNSAPSHPLHVKHATTNVVARFESGDTDVWIDLHDSNSGTYGALLGHNSTELFKVADANVATKLSLSNTGDLTIQGELDASGEVTTTGINIGTDSGDPFNGQSLIRIQDGGNAYVQIKAGTAAAGGFLVGDTDDDFVGGLIYSNSTNSLTLTSGNAVALTLDSSQNATFEGRVTTGEDLRFSGTPRIRADNEINFLTIAGAAQTGKFLSVTAQTAYSGNSASSGMFNALNGYAVGTGNGTTVIDSALNLTNINTISSGTITLSNGSHLQTYTSDGTSGVGGVDLPRGGHITFYGNNSNNHSIGSRGNTGAVTDDLRISSYGALYIDLDSNSNNSADADFVIGRHGSGTLTMTTLVTISGEDGSYTSSGTIDCGAITTTAPEFRYVSNTDSNVGLLIRDETYVSNEADITASRLAAGNNLTLGLAGQVGINAYIGGVNKFSLNSSGNATFAGTIDSGNIYADYSLLGRGFRTANRGELHLNATGATDVAEMFFGYGDGYTDANIRWGISDRGSNDDRLIIYRGPYYGGFTEVAYFDASARMVSSYNGYSVNGTTVIDSARNLDNVNSIDVTSTTSDLNKFTFTDTNSNATFTGLTLDFNASGSQAHTADRTHRALFVDFDTSQTGGNTTDENRAYGIHVDVRGTGDTDLRYGVYSYSETQHSSGTVTSNIGVYGFAAADDTGTGHTTNNYGVHGLAYGYNSGTGGTTNHYGGYFKTLLTNANDKNTSTAHGVYAEVEIDDPGQAQTVTSTYGVRSIIDNDSAGNVTMTNAYLFHGDYQGTIPSGGYGLYIGDNVPNYVGGEIRSANNITAYYSDERLKDFHGKINNPIDKVKQLNGYYFTENKKAKELGYNNDKQQVGVNAQEVQKVLPEVVDIAPISHKEDVNEEYLTVHYDKLVPLLIEAIKDQQQQIDELKAKIENGSS